MSILDRYILTRFLANFAMLFALLFLFAAAIDLILSLDRFVDVARDESESGGALAGAWAFVRLVFDFEAPRVFQFYAYLHGLLGVGAMGFALAQMQRARELTAILASGVSLHRMAMPLIVGMFGLSLLQLLNQELILPRVAPLLLRDYGEIGRRAVDQFPVPLTTFGPDDRNIVQAPAFEPSTQTLHAPTFMERDDQGRSMRRVTAVSATWDASREAWLLLDGRATSLTDPGRVADAPLMTSGTIEWYEGGLQPELLITRRYTQFASMLSLARIARLLQVPGADNLGALRRYAYSRFSVVLANLLVLVIALPCFLSREPVNLMRQSITCAAVAVPSLMFSAMFMMMDMPGIAPAVSVFLPVVVLIPFALSRVTAIRT